MWRQPAQFSAVLEFPEEVLAASRKVPKSIKKTELADRRDLRERTVVTVDGEDAKDLDDAVYVQQISADEYLLGVYIADVSYYVTEDSILDKEARERGTSVYLVDRVLPMLPERLSNGICSLNAGEDRKSRRPASSVFLIVLGTLREAAKTSSGNSKGKSFCLMMDKISKPTSPILPKTSVPLRSALRCS